MSQCSQRRQYFVNLLQCVQNVDFHRDSESALRSCLQNQSNDLGSKLKWHDCIVHKNVFRYCVKHVAMQRCHSAKWYNGLKRSGKAGIICRAGQPPQRTIPRGEQHSSSPCSLLDVIADGLRVSQQRKSGYVTKLCSTFCTTFWVTANLQRVGYPMKFPRYNIGTAMQSHRPCWTGTKGKVNTFLDESRRYERTMTIQGVTPLLMSRISSAAGSGRFSDIHRTHPI